MKTNLIYTILFTVLFLSCKTELKTSINTSNIDYLDSSQKDDQYLGGIKMIPISTPKGDFKVWTKRVGNNPTMKVLLLHGGPGMTHEIYESFDGYFPNEGIEYYYYDQLGSYYSDQPKDLSLWDLESIC